MTSISRPGLLEIRAAPKAKVRNASIDSTRTLLTLVALIYHAVIPYPHCTDAKSARVTRDTGHNKGTVSSGP
jgi:hypothetical protein